MVTVESRSSAEVAALTATGEPGVDEAELESTRRAGGDGWQRRVLARYGLLGALVLICVIFGAIKPGSFLSVANLKSTATIAAPLLVLSVGLTVPLSMGEFDLSIANDAQLSGAVVVSLMSTFAIPWLPSIVVTLVGALAVGALIGFVVVRSKVNAFIVTLGIGTVMAGIEFGITHGATIYSGIPQVYTDLGSGDVGGVPESAIIAVVFTIMVWLLMERTVAGRRMRAIGGNTEAARLSGVRVGILRGSGFMWTALAAAIAGILLTAQASSYYPDAAVSQLLPAYAACFLGTTVFRQNLFEVEGTFVGVAFLAVIQDGLIMVGVAAWVAQVVQGALLVLAVVASKVASRNAG